MSTRKLLEYGGVIAGVILIGFGIGALWMSMDARSTTQDELQREKIVGSEDMSPEGIRAGIEEAGLTGVDVPSCDVAGAADRYRNGCALLLAVHAHPCARVLGRPDLRRDGPLPGGGRSREPGGHQ